MNNVAHILVMLWVAGWTVAMGQAAWRARTAAMPPPSKTKTHRPPGWHPGTAEDFERGGNP